MNGTVFSVGSDRKILDAAAEAFYEKGFGGVGVDGIGERAGLSGPSIYRHFSGKDEILSTLLNEAMDELMTAASPVLDDPVLDLHRALRHHLEFAAKNRHLVNIYQREVRSLVDPWKRPFQRRRAIYTERWESLLARRFPQRDEREIAATTQAVLGMVFSLSYWPARTLAGAPAVELVLDLVEHGLDGVATRVEAAPVA